MLDTLILFSLFFINKKVQYSIIKKKEGAILHRMCAIVILPKVCNILLKVIIFYQKCAIIY